MRLLGLEFNLANVWALPLIVGTAAEYGLNIYVRYLESIDGGGQRFPRTVALGVVLSWLTTMAGFGSLMVAHHHGIFTLGLLLSVGSTASLVAAVFVLPVLIGLFAERSPLPPPRERRVAPRPEGPRAADGSGLSLTHVAPQPEEARAPARPRLRVHRLAGPPAAAHSRQGARQECARQVQPGRLRDGFGAGAGPAPTPQRGEEVSHRARGVFHRPAPVRAATCHR
jgi:hypothetical protein